MLALWFITFIVCWLNLFIQNNIINNVVVILVVLSAIAHLKHLCTIQKNLTKFLTRAATTTGWQNKIIIEAIKDRNIKIFKLVSGCTLFTVTTLPMVIPLLLTQSYLVCSIYTSIRIVKFIRIKQIYTQLKLA